MLKANFKSAFFITLLSTLILLAACSSPEEKKAAQIKEAHHLAEGGDSAQALELLETLSAEYPNDIEILNSIGQIYAAEGDTSMAAFFLEQAYLQAPDDTERLFQAYQSLEAAKQPAGHLLETLSTQAPEAMTPDLWIRLGQIRHAENKLQPSLDAYLKGVDPEKAKPSSEVAASIGQLFVKVGNLPQAEAWLEMAADSDDPDALTALFGLLEINLRQKDWAGAEAIIAQLDKQFPGAVEASQWQQARKDLVRWRATQDAMQAKLAKAEAEKTAAEANVETVAQAGTEGAQREAIDQGSVDKETNGEGKAQVIADLEAAEAMANAPAIETEIPEGEADGLAIEGDAVQAGSQAINFDPSIVIEPADPEITFEVSYDPAPTAGSTTDSVDNNPADESFTAVSAEPAGRTDAFQTMDMNTPAESIRPSERPRTIEERLADAEMAELDRNFTSAIQQYWAAINIANNRAEIWNLLSRAYLVDGQLNNAETAALEAVRLEPSGVAYTLDYLRVAQRTKEPVAFLAELETAYDRFPDSPEITLSLARAHERISEQTETARNLYLRFIDIAPNHPLVPEARAAAARL
ncbi:MAG: tetratricopeptide repeat protein [Puniceicoccaceae bacterium]|nr:tetratricopeptide repeat protein [Puniceicoccaceae bacterium]